LCFGELAGQTHAMYCFWMMVQGKVKIPPAWLTASLKGDWSAPYGMPSDWLPTVLHFRVDENTFAQIEREMHEEKRIAIPDKWLSEAPGACARSWGLFHIG
jgi:hypothetical protein